MNYIYKFTIT